MASGGRIVLPSKKAGETVNVQFNFLSSLGQPVLDTLLSAVVTCVVYSGTDPNPSAMISGGAAISGSQSELATQKITGGLAGVIYALVCTGTTTGGQTLIQTALQAVEANAQGTP